MVAEAVRYVLIVGGFTMVGFNIAIYRNMDMLVYAVRAWRWFVVGKTFMTLFVCWSLWDNRHSPWSWRLPMALVAIVVTIISLVMLQSEYRKRAEE